jgi:amino acid adenylation domain-containing protein
VTWGSEVVLETMNAPRFSEPPELARRPAVHPASLGQQRLWFLDQLDRAAGAAYHLASGWRLQGSLDPLALRAALDAIVARHAALRTSFALLDGQPVQQIAPADVGLHWVEHDFTGLSAEAQREQIQELSAQEASEPFDLSAGPLIRGRLLRLAAQDHLLLITQHHIIFDGWSEKLLRRELAALYAAFSRGQENPLPALDIQYADYAQWQRQWLQGEKLQQQLQFWKSHLGGAPALLQLPTDRPRPAIQTYAGSMLALTLSPVLTAALRRLSRRHGVTLFMTLLAGWSALLSRLGGQSEVVIGTPVANRPRPEFEPLLGFFANTLALRVRLGEDPSVAELLRQIRTTTLEAYAHQDLPFAQVVEALQPTRSLSHNPIFQAMLAYHSTSREETPRLPGLTVSEFRPPHRSSIFDLSVWLRDVGERIEGLLEYATDLFEPATVERMVIHLQAVLEAMVEDDQQRISGLNLLSPAQRRQLLVSFNDTHTPYASGRCIHELFEAWAARAPDAVAALCEDGQLSYGELNRRANQVAHYLIGIGVRPDDRVAICMHRGLELVVGLLGILKAGGAYVPLDPAYPQQRLAYMLEDSEPVAVLTQPAVRATLPALERPVVSLDLQDTGSIIARAPQHDPAASALGLTSSHLAYVIYTSGSTGLPKGVMIEHRSVVNLLTTMARTPGLHDSDVLLAVTTLSFDIAGLELYLPLISGARLLLASGSAAADAQALSQLIRQHAVTVMQATPATWRLLLENGWQGSAELRVLCGGEALPAELAERLAAHNRELWNLYGPTETTIWSTMTRVTASEGTAIASIGRPIANTCIYVLDACGEPVPIGVCGEIHIGGAGVARGYLNRPELTADRFVPDHLSESPGGRLYKTGDLGRWRSDGNLEFLGRNDFQVKVRGFRIEPGEIEARLMQCRGVRQAVVVAREVGHDDQRLVAYLSAEPAAVLSAAQLRGELSAMLPPYMLPSAFVMLESLPVTPNGKLDRGALPAPDQGLVASAEYEAPQGEMEIALARIWQRLLGLPRIGRHDDFFALGGHSMLVLKVVSAIQSECARSIPMGWMFQAPTLALLAALMQQQQALQGWKHLAVMKPGGTGKPLFCLNGFNGDVDDYLNVARFLDASIPIYGLEARSIGNDQAVHEEHELRFESYQQEIRTLQPQGPYRLCGFSFAGAEAFDLARRLEDAGEEVVLILIDAYRPSKWLRMLSWGPRIVSMLRARATLATARRKLRSFLTYELHHWVTGQDKDLRHALFRHARRRTYRPFAGHVVLIKGNRIEEWAYQLQLDGFNGWKKYVTGRFDVIHIDAGHAALMKEPLVKTVAQHLSCILCDATADAHQR